MCCDGEGMMSFVPGAHLTDAECLPFAGQEISQSGDGDECNEGDD
jgi:hypothetical protein